MKIYWIVSFVCYLFIHPFVWAVVQDSHKEDKAIVRELAGFIVSVIFAVIPVVNLIIACFGANNFMENRRG